jgi:hypothetical protein
VRNGAANPDVREFLAAEIELDGVGPGIASLPLVETMKRLSLPSRAMSENVRPENGL